MTGPERASERRLRIALAVLSALGLAIAGYLTVIHYSGSEPFCLASGACERVQSSRYAELAGVPVALLGVCGYLAILASLTIPGEPGRLATAWLAFAGVAFSAYLTYLELFEIDAICQWCVASALVMTAIAVVASVRAWRAPPGRAAEG